MTVTWEKVIRNNMEPLSVVAGQPATLFIARGEKTLVWVLTELGEFPALEIEYIDVGVAILRQGHREPLPVRGEGRLGRVLEAGQFTPLQAAGAGVVKV